MAMRVVLGEREGTRVTLEVEVEAGALERALEDAARRLGRRVKIPGFRPGRAPRALVERYVGADALRDAAVDALLPESYRRALDQTGIDPIDRPAVEVVKAEPGQPFVFKVTVDAKPEVALGQYTGLGVPREPVTVSDEDVAAELAGLAERLARWVPSGATAVAPGHRAIIDYAGQVDGEAFEGGGGEARPVEVGAGRLLPEFERGLVGMAPGETKAIEVPFPDDYPNPALAGKVATFTVTVRAVEERRVPPVDDDLARAAGGFESLDQLKQAIRDELLRARTQAAEQARRERILDAVAANASVDVPEVLVERRIDRAVEDLRHRLSHEGLTLERYLELAQKDEAALRAELRPGARAAVRRELVLEAVARKEHLQASDAEAARLAQAQAEAHDPRRVRAGRGRRRSRRQGERPGRIDPAILEGLREMLTLEKAARFLVQANAAPEPQSPRAEADAPDPAEPGTPTRAAEPGSAGDPVGGSPGETPAAGAEGP